MDCEPTYQPNAADCALEILAHEHSVYLAKSAVRALARIGFRKYPSASPPEWALINLSETLLELLHAVERF